jgi:hypothetical protein
MTDDAGDAACWLDQVCDLCGGYIEHHGEHRCRQAVDGARSTSEPPPTESPEPAERPVTDLLV